jgi:DMATS type aromatic prenyltransferase
MVRVCSAVGFGAEALAESVDVLEELLAPWGYEPIGERPVAPSDIGDDHSPVELSLVLTGVAPEVRVLFEARNGDSSPAGRWGAGEAVNEVIARRFGKSFARLHRIQDLFVPTAATSRYSMWHALCLHPDRPPEFKLYLNPQAHGPGDAPSVVREALVRLGYSRAAIGVTKCARQDDEIKFFSLDIDDSAAARVKVYKLHFEATRGDIERELASARDHVPGALESFWRAVAGSDGPFRGLPISTYLALTTEQDQPTTGAVHFPVRDYWESDRVIHDRVAELLDDVDRDFYQRGMRAFAGRRLEDGIGMQSYVSLRHHRGHRRVTVYLALEAYEVAAPSPGARRARVDRGVGFSARSLSESGGTLTRDPSACSAAASDMGGIITWRPGAVARPRSAEEVQAVVDYCREHGLPLVARGQGHTPFGQSQAPNQGVTMAMSGLSAIRYLDDKIAVVDAGATWGTVLAATAARRRAPPVLTAYQGLSVGGTLSVGGLSGMSYRRGAQIDHVLALDVVTGEGELVSCSDDSDRDLFEAVLAGLGQCAVIVRATLSLAPMPESVRHHTIRFSSLRPFMLALRELALRRCVDGLSGTIDFSSGVPRFEVNAYEFDPEDGPAALDWLGPYTTSALLDTTWHDYAAFYMQVDRHLQNLDVRGLWSGRARPWLDLFLPDSAIDGYLDEVLATLDPAVDVGPPEYGSLGQLHLFPLWRQHLGRPMLRLPAEELVFLFDILSCARRSGPNPAYVRQMLDRNWAFYARARAVGGTRYGIAAIPFSRADWIRELGPVYPRLVRQKRKHDPEHVLGASVSIF